MFLGNRHCLCKEVYIKFENQNHQQERISYGEVSGATHLEVYLHDGSLFVAYCRGSPIKGDFVIYKLIGFNFSKIREFDCERVFEETFVIQERK